MCSLQISVKAAVIGPAIVNAVLVRDGKYNVSSIPNSIKSGTSTGVKFTLVPGRDIPPGEYLMIVSAKDLAGNTLNESRKFTVSK